MTLKKAIAFLVSLSVMTLIMFTISNEIMNEVSINDGVKMIKIRTSAKTVEDVLKKSGITLEEGDITIPEMSAKVSEGMSIVINKDDTAYVIADRKVIDFRTESQKVEDILKESGISIGEHDIVTPEMSYVFPDDVRKKTIKVERVTIVKKSIKEEIPFHTIIRLNKNVKAGDTKVVSPGSNGLSLIEYNVVYEEGKEVSREIVKEQVVKEAKPEILNKGIDKFVVTNRGFPYRYKEIIIMRSTAYDLSIESCGKTPGTKGYGITYSGTKARKGVAAVDPDIIPLGTKLFVESLDGEHDYGFASAEDTGSAINGNRIDLFFENRSDALRYGVREVKVYIMEENEYAEN